MSIWHRHIGVYGICVKESRLLVIKKRGGPYTGRYDLPGGSLEKNESVVDALHREFAEETGCRIGIRKNIGVRDYVVPWTRRGYDHSHCHHIALYFDVDYLEGEVTDSPQVDDSLGAEWMEPDVLHDNNSSPLVMEALHWMEKHDLGSGTKYYEQWEIRQ